MKPLAAVGASLAVIALAGCSYVNPITTQVYYAASDGIHLDVDDVEAQNLIVLATAEGEPATLTGSLVNRGSEDATLEISFDAQTSTEVTVPAGQTVMLSPIDGVEVSGVSPVIPGATTQVGVANDAGGYFSVVAPVLDGTLPEYLPLVEAIG